MRLTEVHQPAPQPSIPLPRLGKEDAIKTSSLEILALGPNTEIRKAATRILCERFFAHGPSRTRLLKDLNATDPDVKRRAKLAFSLLCELGLIQEVVAPRQRTWGINGVDFRTLPRGHLRSRRRGRLGEDDVEERDLRRRRREAVVINEGDRPISQEDVYMRDGEGRISTEEERIYRNSAGSEVLEAAMRRAREILEAQNDGEGRQEAEGASSSTSENTASGAESDMVDIIPH